MWPSVLGKKKKEKGEQPNLCLRKQNQPTHSILVKKMHQIPSLQKQQHRTHHIVLFF
jgi:hypothetical protein